MDACIDEDLHSTLSTAAARQDIKASICNQCDPLLRELELHPHATYNLVCL